MRSEDEIKDVVTILDVRAVPINIHDEKQLAAYWYGIYVALKWVLEEREFLV